MPCYGGGVGISYFMGWLCALARSNGREPEGVVCKVFRYGWIGDGHNPGMRVGGWGLVISAVLLVHLYLEFNILKTVCVCVCVYVGMSMKVQMYSGEVVCLAICE
jgi:hypothetical protein